MINQVTLFLLILVLNLFFSCEFVFFKGELEEVSVITSGGRFDLLGIIIINLFISSSSLKTFPNPKRQFFFFFGVDNI